MIGTPEDLKAWRQRLGLTQQAAAAALHVSFDALRQWEYGRRAIPATAGRLAEILEKYPAQIRDADGRRIRRKPAGPEKKTKKG